MHLVEPTQPPPVREKEQATMNGNLKAWLVPAATAGVLLVLLSTGIVEIKTGGADSITKLTGAVSEVQKSINALQVTAQETRNDVASLRQDFTRSEAEQGAEIRRLATAQAAQEQELKTQREHIAFIERTLERLKARHEIDN